MRWTSETPAVLERQGKQGGSAYAYNDPGYYGSVSWIDIERRYGTVVCLQEYTGAADGVDSRGGSNQLIPIIDEAFDAVY
ncbi:MAG: hypothetical protein ACJ04P_07685 [Halioglobus sp.]